MPVPVPAAPAPADLSVAPADPAAPAAGLYATVLAWLGAHLAARGYHRPTQKRLALLISGLLAGERAATGALADALAGLAITPAQEPSIARRLARLLDDPRLDPARVLPDLLGPLLPALLRGALQAHAANERAGVVHHRRLRLVQLVLDESSVDDRTHVLLVGLAVAGVVLPLGLRCWPQNQPLPPGTYGLVLEQVLLEVQALLPPALRDHVLLLADRAYGIPRLVDLCARLGWAYVLRAQGQTHVHDAAGQEYRLRDLAPRPGTGWWGGADLGRGDPDATDGDAAGPPLQVFKRAGWRNCQVVADWAHGQAEPWLLLTNLPGTPARVREYARRWAIERTFLSWKSQGWQLERCGLPDPQRLGRLLTGVALATLWRLAFALPGAHLYLEQLRARQPRWPRQLPLPLVAPRPWSAKFSLLTWGAKAARRVDLRTVTPPRRWELPVWDATRTWSELCREAYAAPA